MKFRVLVLVLLLATIVNANNNGAYEADEGMTSNGDDIRAQLVDLQQRHVGWLLDHPDVTGVDVNHKTVGGEQTDQLSLVIWVKKKLPEEKVLEKRRLPREIEGFQTDVVEGEIELLSTWSPEPSHSMTTLTPTTTTEPPISMTTLTPITTTEPPISMTTLTPTTTTKPPMPVPTTNISTSIPVLTSTTELNGTESISIPTPTPEPCPCRDPLTALRGGHCIMIKKSRSVGTLGYFTKKGSDIGILSNFHVTGPAGNMITSTRNTLKDRKRVTLKDLKFPKDFVATVTVAQCNKLVDASHSMLCDDPPPPFMLEDGTKVPGTQQAQCYDQVRFCGCVSGCTKSERIYSTNFCASYICPPQKKVIICNQILFTPVPCPGDSGSLLINAGTNNATGLVFARVWRIIDGRVTYPYGVANPIQTVLKQLGVTLAV